MAASYTYKRMDVVAAISDYLVKYNCEPRPGCHWALIATRRWLRLPDL